MKVIKPGRKQEGWAELHICYGIGNGGFGCNSEILVEIGDLFQTIKHCYDGSSEYFITFKCGYCGVLNDIKNAPVIARWLLKQPEWEAEQKRKESQCNYLCHIANSQTCQALPP